ncbi:unnamed protein product [Adineta steineri]|uniref:Uncharacterized protein n=1 Tax=Adineta steineri TaxID=433720 RepID=A0A813XHN5_9BILA|nr:unnamed protein product [Adineta steineri]CAF3803480.1 unnamed protein product [Adineta steineri]
MYRSLHGHLEEKEIELVNHQNILQQDLVSATKMLKERSTRLATIVNSKDFNDVGIAELLMTAANAKLSILKAQLLENSENLNRLRKKQEKGMMKVNIICTNCIVFVKVIGNIMTMRMNYEKSGESQDFWPKAGKTGRF